MLGNCAVCIGWRPMESGGSLLDLSTMTKSRLLEWGVSNKGGFLTTIFSVRLLCVRIFPLLRFTTTTTLQFDIFLNDSRGVPAVSLRRSCVNVFPPAILQRIRNFLDSEVILEKMLASLVSRQANVRRTRSSNAERRRPSPRLKKSFLLEVRIWNLTSLATIHCSARQRTTHQ